MFDLQSGSFDALQEEQPVGKVRIDQHVQIRELDQKRRMPDPGDGDLAVIQFGKGRAFMLAGAAGQEGFPDHFLKKSTRIEMLRGSQVLERPRQTFPRRS